MRALRKISHAHILLWTTPRLLGGRFHNACMPANSRTRRTCPCCSVGRLPGVTNSSHSDDVGINRMIRRTSLLIYKVKLNSNVFSNCPHLCSILVRPMSLVRSLVIRLIAVHDVGSLHRMRCQRVELRCASLSFRGCRDRGVAGGAGLCAVSPDRSRQRWWRRYRRIIDIVDIRQSVHMCTAISITDLYEGRILTARRRNWSTSPFPAGL